jgi:hypothetical protein
LKLHNKLITKQFFLLAYFSVVLFGVNSFANSLSADSISKRKVKTLKNNKKSEYFAGLAHKTAFQARLKG